MGKIRPHLVRYWLHSSEKTEHPETFAQKVNEICSIYDNAMQAAEHGLHTVSADEMTGIQALERKYPDKPVMPGRTARMRPAEKPAMKISFLKEKDFQPCRMC